jgi:hypothetical protein
MYLFENSKMHFKSITQQKVFYFQFVKESTD